MISIDPDVGQFEAGDDPQQRGLAAAARAEQGGEFAVLDVDRDVVQRDEIAEPLGHVAHADCHQLFSLGRSTEMTMSATIAINASRNAAE